MSRVAPEIQHQRRPRQPCPPDVLTVTVQGIHWCIAALDLLDEASEDLRGGLTETLGQIDRLRRVDT